jgi:hypothetical protein
MLPSARLHRAGGLFDNVEEMNMTILDRMLAKHKSFVDDVTKLRDKRDKALELLIKAEARYRKSVKAVSRSQKRLDKTREEERQAKIARKQAKEESKKEIPDIAAVLGV